MALFSIPDIRITGVASAAPEAVADNLDLDLIGRDEKAAFVEKVGIRMRRIAPGTMCASDLCVSAAERLLALRNENPEGIGGKGTANCGIRRPQSICRYRFRPSEERSCP